MPKVKSKPGTCGVSISVDCTAEKLPAARTFGMAMARVWTTTPCEASRSFCARMIFGFCRRAMLMVSASESGWVVKTFVAGKDCAGLSQGGH